MTATISVAEVRCEYLINPLGIDVESPRLSWTLQSEQRAQWQSAYQILVASSEAALERDEADLWNSGKVMSAQSIHVAYNGKKLLSEQQCWWKVRVWDRDGNVSADSAVAEWEMGLLQPANWQAQWIGLDESAELAPSPYLRKTVTFEQPVRRARLYITARGMYEASINGKRVGNAVLSPGWTDYHQRIQYQTYDVTDLLSQGENVLGSILGAGWYGGHIGWSMQDRNYHHYGAQPQLLFQLHVTYADGTSEIIASDATWRGSSAGPLLFSDLLAGEMYDARQEFVGWNTLHFAADSWQAVSVQPLDAVQLVADRAQPVQITEEIQPQALSHVAPDTVIFDMGQNMVGWVRLHVQGKAGTRVQLRFVEMLNPDGSIYTTNLRSAKQTDTYILKGDGPEVFEPHFTFHGFRYVEVSGYPGEPTLAALTGCVIHSATPPAGSFECSHPMVNALQHNITWGQRGNFLSVPTDCPQRDERLGWMGDAQIFVRTACYNMDVAPFFTKWMSDVRDAQSAEGAFPDVAPRLVVPADGAPAWGNAGVIVPWTLYSMYGDTRIIAENYDAMVRWIEYLHQANPDLLWTKKMGNNYGDWLSIQADTPKEVLATAYFAYDTKLLSQMATALGRYEDAEKYEALFQSIKAAFCNAYVRADGRIEGDTQTCYVLALHMDLLPSELRPLAAKRLVADIEKKGGHLSTGFVGVGYLCPVLTEAGYSEVAYRLLLNDTFPSWGYSIKHGATTIWERWDGWTEEHGFQDPGMNSFNHYSLGSVGQWLYQYVAGIDLTGEQQQRYTLHPYIGGELTSVNAEYRSIYGTIGSHWSIENGTFTLRATIPVNTTATVFVPAAHKSQIFEHGSLAQDAEGVTFLREEDESVVFEVKSGTYEFQVK